jgi:hypothetical protein
MPVDILILMQPAIASVTSNLLWDTMDTASKEVVKRRDRSGSHRRVQNVSASPMSDVESSVAQIARYPVSIVFKFVPRTRTLNFPLPIRTHQSRVDSQPRKH